MEPFLPVFFVFASMAHDLQCMCLIDMYVAMSAVNFWPVLINQIMARARAQV